MGTRILHIDGKGIQGKDFSHELTRQVTVFTGRNGAGKTTRLKAVDLALRGPRKDDTRFGDTASVHVRLQVGTAVHEGARVDVMRALSPKHTLALPPVVQAGSKSVTQAQGVLDGIVQLLPVVFDVRTFTDLSADKQKAALLPFATFVDASRFSDIWPSVPPFDGESGSDYLGRLRVAISEECKVLSARKLAAERAQVELANHADRSVRNAADIRADIARLEEVAAIDAKREALLSQRDELDARVQELHVQLDEAKDNPGQLRKAARSSAEVRVELAAVEERMSAWRKRVAFDQSAQSIRETHAAAVKWLEQASAQVAEVMVPACDPGALLVAEGDLARCDAGLHEMTALAARLEGCAAEVAAARRDQLLPKALLAAVQACPDAAGRDALLDELRAVLGTSGFPAIPALEQSMKDARARLDQLHGIAGERAALAARVAELREDRERYMRAVTLKDAREAELRRAQAEVDRSARAVQQMEQDAPPEATFSEDDSVLWSALTVELDEAVTAERVALASERDAQQLAAWRAELAMLGNRRTDLCAELLALGDTEDPAPRLAELRLELDAAVRAEGKVEAERTAYQNADTAAQALADAKAAEKRAKAASDECLRESMGAVASAFGPFCHMLGGTWRLGDERPLGLERDGQWVDFEHLSESERLVYGIGLVMALSTTGKGLRMVMLDGLDSCDVERRRAIVEQAVRLIKAGQLDNVLGTAWSREGFEDDSVQVIEV
jgi:hypothetical protein